MRDVINSDRLIMSEIDIDQKPLESFSTSNIISVTRKHINNSEKMKRQLIDHNYFGIMFNKNSSKNVNKSVKRVKNIDKNNKYVFKSPILSPYSSFAKRLDLT